MAMAIRWFADNITNLSGHASGPQIGLRIEQYEYCGHSPVGLFVHAMLDVEPLELIEKKTGVKAGLT
jgi:hypothetical protein